MISDIASPLERHTLAELLSSPAASPRRFVFGTLIRVIRTASLETLLDQPGPFTVFAPNDGAFARMPNEEFDDLVQPDHEAWLVEVITYHIVPGYWPAAALTNRTVRAVNGERVAARHVGPHLLVNNAKILTSDIPARNGVVHEIDGVLVPPRKKGTPKRKGKHR